MDSIGIHERGGLPNLQKRLVRNEHVTVAFLGGSITEGAGASDPSKTSWRALTEQYLRNRFPKSSFLCINAGVGGTDSTFGAHRLQEHVFSKGDIDLLFVEFSVNDRKDRTESIRGMEGIVRMCKRLSPRTDICFLYTASDTNLSEKPSFNIAVHEEVASHYGIPSVNFAAKLYARIGADLAQWEALAPDRIHPNDAGHALYAEFLCAYLEKALCRNLASDFAWDNTPVPPPLDFRNYEFASMADFRQADFINGFEIRTAMPEPFMNWRYNAEHLFTELPGASLSFKVQGQGAGLLLICGPDTGMFEYSLDGIVYHRVNPFDDWCSVTFRPVVVMFPLQMERRSMHIIVRNSPMKDERSLGTSLRILKILSN